MMSSLGIRVMAGKQRQRCRSLKHSPEDVDRGAVCRSDEVTRPPQRRGPVHAGCLGARDGAGKARHPLHV